jgi:hypothetical protein
MLSGTKRQQQQLKAGNDDAQSHIHLDCAGDRDAARVSGSQPGGKRARCPQSGARFQVLGMDLANCIDYRFPVHEHTYRGKHLLGVHGKARQPRLVFLWSIRRCSGMLLVRVDQFCSFGCGRPGLLGQCNDPERKARRCFCLAARGERSTDAICGARIVPAAIRASQTQGGFCGCPAGFPQPPMWM